MPRSGQVIDAETGKPIEGAIVCMQWKTGGFLGVAGPSFAALYETKTDSQGKYYVPSQHLKRRIWLEGVDDEEVLVYKDGYPMGIVWFCFRPDHEVKIGNYLVLKATGHILLSAAVEYKKRVHKIVSATGHVSPRRGLWGWGLLSGRFHARLFYSTPSGLDGFLVNWFLRVSLCSPGAIRI